MKNRLTIALSVFLAIATICGIFLTACSGSEASPLPTDTGKTLPQKTQETLEPTTEPTPEPTPEPAPIVYEYRVHRDDIFADPGNAKTGLKSFWTLYENSGYIPTYRYEDIFYTFYETVPEENDVYRRPFNLPSDYSRPSGSYDWASFFSVTARMPYGAVRNPEDGGNPYLMYNTDRGQRLFIFFNRIIPENTYSEKYINERGLKGYDFDSLKTGDSLSIVGHVAVMDQTLSFDAVRDVLVEGAELRDLAEVDSAFIPYADYLYGYFLYDHDDEEKGIERRMVEWEERGIYINSLTLYTDGALKIYWGFKDGEFIVDSYEFREDFTFETYGVKVCYKIHPDDYVDNR